MNYNRPSFEKVNDASIEIYKANKVIEIILSNDLSEDENVELIEVVGDYCYSASKKCYDFMQDPNNKSFSMAVIEEIKNKTNRSVDEILNFLRV